MKFRICPRWVYFTLLILTAILALNPEYGTYSYNRFIQAMIYQDVVSFNKRKSQDICRRLKPPLSHDAASSSCSLVFFKTSVLKSLANFTGKHLCWSLFFKKRVQHMCFPVKFAKFLRTPLLTEHFRSLLLDITSSSRSLVSNFTFGFFLFAGDANDSEEDSLNFNFESRNWIELNWVSIELEHSSSAFRSIKPSSNASLSCKMFSNV